MMTGQVLGGSPPLLAAKYQAVIMFLICFSSASVLCSALLLAFRTLFDPEGRLHTHLLVRRDGAKPKDMLMSLVSSMQAVARHGCWALMRRPSDTFRQLEEQPEGERESTSMASATRTSSASRGAFRQSSALAAGTGEVPLLALRMAAVNTLDGTLLVAEASLLLHRHVPVVVSGPSGCGKSSLLKALACLLPLSSGSIELDGQPPGRLGAARWRRRVCYVRQAGGAGLPGSPRDLYVQLLKLGAQRERAQGDAEQSGDVQQVAATNGTGEDVDGETVTAAALRRSGDGSGALAKALDAIGVGGGLIDQAWSSLSGGQSQRLYLGVMVALKPQVPS